MSSPTLPPPGGKLAILACGGPAPGINSVIAAATIRACLSKIEVLGIQEGYRHLMEGDTSHVTPLSIQNTSRIHFRGGSFIGIARGSPAGDPARMAKTLEALHGLGVTMLISIGGDGSAFVAHALMKASRGRLRVVHVPKTIDNDIDLPFDVPTFGFQTARHIGVELVENLMVDAKTTRRWYFVVAQGRNAGHLALGIGKAAGATLSLIPEEFPRGTRLARIVDTLVGAIVKRIADGGRTYGVAILAEGLAGVLDPQDLSHCPRDEHGNVALASVRLADIVQDATITRLRELRVNVAIQAKTVGYELRCADPIPFDMEYTRDLGHAAAKFLADGGEGAMVTMQNGRFVPIPLDEVIDPKTGRSRVRLVDLESDRYRIAHSYMVRLKQRDFDDPGLVTRLAEICHLTPEAFREQFLAVAS